MTFFILNAIGGELFARSGLQAYPDWSTWGTFLVGLAARVALASIIRRQPEPIRA